MQIRLEKFKENPSVFMRSCGYAFDRLSTGALDGSTSSPQVGDEWSFMRRMSGYDYPRFHAYVHLESDALVVNLHIDQKKPSYSGSRAHSGEYSGELVEQECQRIMGLLPIKPFSPKHQTGASFH